MQPHEDAPRFQTWAATAEFVDDIDTVQYEELHEGPCITCMQSRRVTVSGSLGSDSRWPHFGGRVARMAVHSALSLPLIVGDRVIGAINAYARSRDAFGEHAVQLGTQFAGPAAVSVYNGQLLDHAQERTAQLQRALSNRAVIDQAIGIIRSRSGASAEEAFDRLTRLSQTENIKLHIVAPSGWWTRRCGAHVCDSASNVLAAWRIRRWRQPVPGGQCRSVISRRATSVRCSPLARA